MLKANEQISIIPTPPSIEITNLQTLGIQKTIQYGIHLKQLSPKEDNTDLIKFYKTVKYLLFKSNNQKSTTKETTSLSKLKLD
jgi:hypothetical protein